MHDYKKNIDFELLRKVHLLKCINNNNLYELNDEQYEVQILNLNTDDIKLDEHFDNNSCIFCNSSNDKKIFIENVLCQSYLEKIQFKDFDKLLKECINIFDNLHQTFCHYPETGLIFKIGKSNYWFIKDQIRERDVLKKQIFTHDLYQSSTNRSEGRNDILRFLGVDENFAIKNTLLEGGLHDVINISSKCCSTIYYCMLHKINPYKYILDNDLHYKLYKGFEDILNEYEHDKN
jgi:hypothetical protein